MFNDRIKPSDSTCPEIATNCSNATGNTFKINFLNLIIPLFTLEMISQGTGLFIKIIIITIIYYHQNNPHLVPPGSALTPLPQWNSVSFSKVMERRNCDYSMAHGSHARAWHPIPESSKKPQMYREKMGIFYIKAAKKKGPKHPNKSSKEQKLTGKINP